MKERDALAKWTSYISAGWAIVGSIRNQLQTLAWQCDCDISFTVSTGITGRTISFKVEGGEDDVRTFRRSVIKACERMGA